MNPVAPQQTRRIRLIQTLGTTTNFLVTFQDTDPVTNQPLANAQRRAEQLMATCESDFAQVRGWFGINDGFGTSNRVTLQVEPESLARNYGYKKGRRDFHPHGSLKHLRQSGTG